MKKTLFATLFALAFIVIISCNNNGSKQTVIQNPEEKISDDSLLNLIEYKTFLYFWDGAEPVSGMARERYHTDGVYPQNDYSVVTTGGSGFGIMAVVAGIKRGYVTREKGFERLRHIVDYLGKADRFHGAYPHWLNGETGRVKPFGTKDNGADIVETAYLFQGLLATRQYYAQGNEEEKKLASDIDKLWRDVEWDFFTNGGKSVIYWHWSPEYKWEMNFPIEGYNECLILYVLAASSPTHPVDPAVYHKGWARNGAIKSDKVAYGLPLILKHNYAETYGGPLFWAHYSYLGLNPKGLSDQYADYWKLNVNQALINYNWCVENPKKYPGYSASRWGLTASYSPSGYAAHAPGMESDLGVITPSAALSSFPYTPAESMAALNEFYYRLGDKILGKYGFYDAFSEQANWYPTQYLAIDQGPIAVMIENYRSGLLWDLFMGCPEVKTGLKNLGFVSESYK